jgi:hypothetical protein
VPYSDGKLGNAELLGVFKNLREIQDEETSLVDLTGVSSNLFLDWIREADALRRAAA